MSETNKRGRGRPKKNFGEKVVVDLHFCLDTNDAANLKRICENDKISRTKFLRNCIQNRIYEMDYKARSIPEDYDDWLDYGYDDYDEYDEYGDEGLEKD